MVGSRQNGNRGQAEFHGDDEILLGVLTAVDRDAEISQRTISREVGVALGLANAYLKRCVRKGWIKVQQVPRRRYVYYLTPQGFAEKTRLAGEYFSASFMFFRRARDQLSELMDFCASNGWHKVTLVGVSDLAEVATICAQKYPIKISAVIDEGQAGNQFYGVPVVTDLADCEGVDAAIVTGTEVPEVKLKAIMTRLGAERMLTPRLLRGALPKSVTAEPTLAAAK